VAFTVGTQKWPFPVPVVRKDGRWRLDSASGRIEILARRVGRNELNVMEICRGYADAQIEYAAGVRDGDRVLKYAQKIVSAPGKEDGLYWDGAPYQRVRDWPQGFVAFVGPPCREDAECTVAHAEFAPGSPSSERKRLFKLQERLVHRVHM
jgi:hypothetical protein